jgi:hypothetical protein
MFKWLASILLKLFGPHREQRSQRENLGDLE